MQTRSGSKKIVKCLIELKTRTDKWKIKCKFSLLRFQILLWICIPDWNHSTISNKHFEFKI